MGVTRRSQIAAVAAGAIGAVLLGLAAVAVRFSPVGPQATAFWRYIFALPLLFAAAGLARSAAPGKQDLTLLVAAGVCFTADIALFNIAIFRTAVANASLLANMTPIIAAAAGWLFFRERPTRAYFLGASGAVLGALLLTVSRSNSGQGSGIGDMLAAGAAFWYAGYLLILQRVRGRVTAAIAMGITTLTAAGVAAVATGIMGEAFLPIANSWRSWGVLIFLGVVVHAGGQGLVAYGFGRLPIALSTALLWISPLSTAFFGWIVFNETLSPAGLAGAVLVLAGVFVVQSLSRARPDLHQ